MKIMMIESSNEPEKWLSLHCLIYKAFVHKLARKLQNSGNVLHTPRNWLPKGDIRVMDIRNLSRNQQDNGYLKLEKNYAYDLPSHQENMSVTCIPLELLFYVANLGYGGVYIFFLFLHQNIECVYLLESLRQGGSNLYPQSMFCSWKLKHNVSLSEIHLTRGSFNFSTSGVR